MRMKLTRRTGFWIVIVLSLGSHAAVAAHVTGAGSSFAAPLYEAWGERARSTEGLVVNYQSIGSGAGQNQVIAGTVDFGATDQPLPMRALLKHHLYQFPTAMGGIVIIVNLPIALNKPLCLSGEVLAQIYSGEIETWNDPRIASLNPGLVLPDLEIAPLHRADASGTTWVFTSYLARVWPIWDRRFGEGTSVAWTSGVGARGNDGVASAVKNTEGSIGYVEYAYAKRNRFAMVSLKNRSGYFVSPNMESFNAAVQAATWNKSSDGSVALLDVAAPLAWPIMSATYALVPLHQINPSVKAFFQQGFFSGDFDASALDYVALPQEEKEQILLRWPKEGKS